MAKILIVSKDESFVELISPWFKEKGHEVKKETKLSEGLRLLDTHQSDMVILDLTIPQTEPYDELINRYISDLVSRRVIITGGYLTGNRMQEYIKQEALDVFEKPLKLQTGFTGEGELKERLMASLVP
jgi:DNA-binding NtrC family response regulator